MSVVPYTRLQLIQRLRKHINDGYASDSYTVSDRELMLYVDQAVAFQIVGLAYQNAKIEGALAVAEAFLITYNITIINQDDNTGYWFATLPQPPLSLPLGYSINRVYFASPGSGISQDAFPIKAKRVGYRNNMPMPTGIRYWVEGSTLWMSASNSQPLRNLNLYVQMPSARVDDLSAPMNMPDDIIQGVFDKVITELINRYQQPKDIVVDDLPAGNNNLKP